MKLVITVIEDDDTQALIDSLTEHSFRATKLASTGGFLLQGNTTLLIGVEDTQVEQVLGIIRKTCVRRKKLLPHTTAELPTAVSLPIEVDAGGATTFVISVEDFQKI